MRVRGDKAAEEIITNRTNRVYVAVLKETQSGGPAKSNLGPERTEFWSPVVCWTVGRPQIDSYLVKCLFRDRMAPIQSFLCFSPHPHSSNHVLMHPVNNCNWCRLYYYYFYRPADDSFSVAASSAAAAALEASIEMGLERDWKHLSPKMELLLLFSILLQRSSLVHHSGWWVERDSQVFKATQSFQSMIRYIFDPSSIFFSIESMIIASWHLFFDFTPTVS